MEDEWDIEDEWDEMDGFFPDDDGVVVEDEGSVDWLMKVLWPYDDACASF